MFEDCDCDTVLADGAEDGAGYDDGGGGTGWTVGGCGGVGPGTG